MRIIRSTGNIDEDITLILQEMINIELGKLIFENGSPISDIGTWAPFEERFQNYPRYEFDGRQNSVFSSMGVIWVAARESDSNHMKKFAEIVNEKAGKFLKKLEKLLQIPVRAGAKDKLLQSDYHTAFYKKGAGASGACIIPMEKRLLTHSRDIPSKNSSWRCYELENYEFVWYVQRIDHYYSYQCCEIDIGESTETISAILYDVSNVTTLPHHSIAWKIDKTDYTLYQNIATIPRNPVISTIGEPFAIEMNPFYCRILSTSMGSYHASGMDVTKVRLIEHPVFQASHSDLVAHGFIGPGSTTCSICQFVLYDDNYVLHEYRGIPGPTRRKPINATVIVCPLCLHASQLEIEMRFTYLLRVKFPTEADQVAAAYLSPLLQELRREFMERGFTVSVLPANEKEKFIEVGKKFILSKSHLSFIFYEGDLDSAKNKTMIRYTPLTTKRSAWN